MPWRTAPGRSGHRTCCVFCTLRNREGPPEILPELLPRPRRVAFPVSSTTTAPTARGNFWPKTARLFGLDHPGQLQAVAVRHGLDQPPVAALRAQALVPGGRPGRIPRLPVQRHAPDSGADRLARSVVGQELRGDDPRHVSQGADHGAALFRRAGPVRDRVLVRYRKLHDRAATGIMATSGFRAARARAFFADSAGQGAGAETRCRW